MKIGIMTLPSKINYGGILQAYALQTFLISLGYEVVVINRAYNPSPQKTIIRFSKLLKFLLHRKQPMKDFINKNVILSRPLYTTQQLKDYCEEECIDIYIVGSDQVWRPQYSPNILNYFFDFLIGRDVKRISYAASFGVDRCDYQKDLLSQCSCLLKSFDGVSVREESAVHLCKKYFQVDAVHVLDPTMLLKKEVYESLINNNISHPVFGDLFCYILNMDDNKKNIIRSVASSLSLKPYYVVWDSLRESQDSPSQWLRNIKDAELIVTDSFHGAVFSIIFRKNFWVVENSKRGMTRLESLLSMFGLENRIVKSSEIKELDFSLPINWDSVFGKLDKWRDVSVRFLLNSLSE